MRVPLRMAKVLIDFIGEVVNMFEFFRLFVNLVRTHTCMLSKIRLPKPVRPNHFNGSIDPALCESDIRSFSVQESLLFEFGYDALGLSPSYAGSGIDLLH